MKKKATCFWITVKVELGGKSSIAFCEQTATHNHDFFYITQKVWIQSDRQGNVSNRDKVRSKKRHTSFF